MQKRSELNEMARHILSSTELLMARDGLQNLSIHKIAKEAGLASGTLYLHFKNKDDLLYRLIYDLYDRFCRYSENRVNQEASVEEQYKQLWQSKWEFLHENPTVAVNLYQYYALLGLQEFIHQISHCADDLWNQFVMRGKAEGIIAPLPNEILYSLSLNVVTHLAYIQAVGLEQFSAKTLEDVMIRTWKAITF